MTHSRLFCNAVDRSHGDALSLHTESSDFEFTVRAMLMDVTDSLVNMSKDAGNGICMPTLTNFLTLGLLLNMIDY